MSDVSEPRDNQNLGKKPSAKAAWNEANKEKRRQYARDFKARQKATDPDGWLAKQREASRKAYWGHPGKQAPTNQDRHFRLKYGITLAQRDEMIKRQGGCAACRSPEPGSKRGWVVDHCHTTKVVRGVLCNSCNVALGLMGDDPTRLQSLIRYLAESKDTAFQNHQPERAAA